ncbi:CRISPR-associated protein Cas4 [Natrialbaceae archaeon AArc-T1-2]|uniref:CRISPR-associated protein Cas4 n=1 Tax=Natrialbaceae archaeon AArc-T1-2 TaxID=3053904 RepID=UPI00255AF50B|nr:Dna2/Cas4 domain-containing protein [Natrialbaceae archaeon AArc-T1-2]WIV66415.1 Dna2/Cas4 domain-containing protein [Natrialbaceae archaeon AArc-T1-2]
MSFVSFSDLRTAAYCPRKLYYRRRDDDREPPEEVERVRDLAYRYDDVLEASNAALSAEPIAVSPASYRDRLERTRTRLERTGRWESIRDPVARDRLVTGRHCRGIVHKVLADPLEPSVVSPGRPPERGVWEPHTVQAVAAAKALAWEHETAVETAVLEYPAYGVIRRIELTTRRKALYRRTLRTVRALDGPPARVRNRSKCESCAYASDCGVTTRTLRSLLGLE